MTTEPPLMSFESIVGSLGYIQGKLSEINDSVLEQDFEREQWKRILDEVQKVIDLSSSIFVRADYQKTFGRARLIGEATSYAMDLLKPFTRLIQSSKYVDGDVIDVEWLDGTRESFRSPYEVGRAVLERSSVRNKP